MCREALGRLVRFLEGRPEAIEAERRTRVAAAVLMVECARVDSEFSDAERRAVAGAMIQLFDLEGDAAEVLLAIAEKRAEEVWHDWILTEAIRRGFQPAEREALIGKLWKIAEANGVLHHQEEAFVRRIAQALGVPESAAMRGGSPASDGRREVEPR